MKSKLIIDKYGNKYWSNEKGQLHREDGPAFERGDRYKSWWINDYLHRKDGPAIEYFNNEGKYTCYWYFHGKLINCNSQEEFERITDLIVFE